MGLFDIFKGGASKRRDRLWRTRGGVAGEILRVDRRARAR